MKCLPTQLQPICDRVGYRWLMLFSGCVESRGPLVNYIFCSTALSYFHIIKVFLYLMISLQSNNNSLISCESVLKVPRSKNATKCGRQWVNEASVEPKCFLKHNRFWNQHYFFWEYMISYVIFQLSLLNKMGYFKLFLGLW